MKRTKRFLSIFLAALCLCTCLTVPSKAAPVKEGQVTGQGTPSPTIRPQTLPTEEDLTTSAQGLDFIKAHEGYSATPYGDNTQTSIGYGCSTAFAKKYGFSTEYLTEEEAHELLVCVVAEFEVSLDRFLANNKLKLSQTQYDALISFTFNLGTGWLSGCRLSRALVGENYTVNQFASAMGIWCHVGSSIVEGLVNRRIDEITLFLYGAYSLSDTDKRFCTLIYDGSGTFDNDIDFYLAGEPYGSFSTVTPPSAGLYFAGWLTADGRLITEDTIVTESLTVFVRWSETQLPLEGYEIRSLQLLTAGGAALTEIPDGGFYAEAEIVKGLLAEEAVVMIVSYTADGRMLDTHYLRADVPNGSVYSLGAWIANKDGSVGRVKAFVLSGLAEGIPLCEAAEVF